MTRQDDVSSRVVTRLTIPRRDFRDSRTKAELVLLYARFSCRVTNNKLLLESVRNNLTGNCSRWRYVLHASLSRRGPCIAEKIDIFTEVSGAREIIEKSMRKSQQARHAGRKINIRLKNIQITNNCFTYKQQYIIFLRRFNHKFQQYYNFYFDIIMVMLRVQRDCFDFFFFTFSPYLRKLFFNKNIYIFGGGKGRKYKISSCKRIFVEIYPYRT